MAKSVKAPIIKFTPATIILFIAILLILLFLLSYLIWPGAVKGLLGM
jgi:hypothetical protein